MKRLSYHGWAALLLVLAFVLVAGGIALGVTPGTVPSTLPNGDPVTIACGAPWAPSTVGQAPECVAGFAGRGSLAWVLILFGVVLFGAELLVGMVVAGVRDALAAAPHQPSATTVGPEPSRPAPQA